MHDGYIQMVVAVKVGDRNSERIGRRRKILAREIPTAVAEQDGNRTCFKVRRHDVCIAVRVQVGCAQAMIRHFANFNFHPRSLKCAITLAEDHEYFTFCPTINGNIRFLIAIEIRGRDSVRMRIALNIEW